MPAQYGGFKEPTLTAGLIDLKSAIGILHGFGQEFKPSLFVIGILVFGDDEVIAGHAPIGAGFIGGDFDGNPNCDGFSFFVPQKCLE